ncbi:MAG: glycosyltransferase family 2 protein [Rhabdochlamydiaceae bacterium]|jgi:glycosyltransferase involved in cell wall biosynthesis
MISVTILTKNSSATLGDTLLSIRDFPEVVIFDTGSTDGTLEIASQFPNVKVYRKEFKGFGPSHNEASSLATYDWILSLDSDEVLSKELSVEILNLDLKPEYIYRINRENYFNGKQIKCCSGWYPDWIVRLYNRKKTSFSNAAVHEKIEQGPCQVKGLQHPIRHIPYLDIESFLTKMQNYSSLFAIQNKGKKKSSLFRAIFHGLHAFFKSYILKRGFMGGAEGFIISIYNGQTSFYKYLKLKYLNKNNL